MEVEINLSLQEELVDLQQWFLAADGMFNTDIIYHYKIPT